MNNIPEESLIANAFPAKRFFVTMLTRDIDLSDAILDLLDNCVDGIIRSNQLTKSELDSDSPYSGYFAKIQMNENFFSIEDNCGGIPLDIATEYAFMMGRDKEYDKNLPTVGMYGIGMKRALFKMGRNSTVKSVTNQHSFEVIIDRAWLEDESNWKIPIKITEHDKTAEKGTKILINDLYPGISDWFSNDTFINNFREVIAHNFSYIISKGFEIYVNGEVVKSAPLTLLFDEKSGITPYIYSAKIGSVDILLQVGFSKDIPSSQEIEQELKTRHSKEDSGWTVVCNDRVVIYKDKTILTGWGEAGVPNYHSQFNGINGIVFFSSNNPEELPLNTMKRGIEHSSPLYLEVKNHMRTGTKLFTNYTNDWKKFRGEDKLLKQETISLETNKVIEAVEPSKWKTLSSKDDRIEKVYKPVLPKPKPKNTFIQITFRRESEEIKKVSQYLFNNPDTAATTVGNECFEIILRSIEEE